VDDVIVLKTAHMDNGINFPDVGQKLIAQSSPWLRTLTKPAISTNSTRAGTSCAEVEILAEPLTAHPALKRHPRSVHSAEGKLASALALATKALNNRLIFRR